MTTGWKLRRDERESLLALRPPRYLHVVADHVTLVPQAQGEATVALPPTARARVVGQADDMAGVEALVVEIDGKVERAGGGIYHVTWSLAEGRTARESNDVIARFGWQAFDGGLLTLDSARW